MTASVSRAQAVEEAGRRRVDVEAADGVGTGGPEAVDAVARSGEEVARTRDVRLVADAELDVAFENVERVHVVVMGMRVDALELGLECHVDHRELWEVAEDPVGAHGATKDLGVLRFGEDRVGKRPPAVGRRVVLVEARILAADVVAEAARGSVEVEEDRGRVARISEGVDDVGRCRSESARSRADRPGLGAERDFDLALEHVEGVGVVMVDVRVRPFLAGLVAEPRHDHVVELAEDPQRPLGTVGDGLALAGR